MDEVLRLLQSLHTKIDAQQTQLGQLEETIEARLQPLERFFQQQQGQDGPDIALRLPAGLQAAQLALQDGQYGGEQLEAQHLEGADDGLAVLGMAEAEEWTEEQPAAGEPATTAGRQQAAAEAAAPAAGGTGSFRRLEARQMATAGRRLQPQQLQAQVEHRVQGTILQEQEQQQQQRIRPVGDPDTWHLFSLPRRQPGSYTRKISSKLWLTAGLGELAPQLMPDDRGSAHGAAGPIGHRLQREQRPDWPQQVVTNSRSVCGRASLDRVASRVRMPAYAARVQQQWRRQLIAFDQEKLEALGEDAEGSGSESESTGEGNDSVEPQFGMFRVQADYELEQEVLPGEEEDVIPWESDNQLGSDVEAGDGSQVSDNEAEEELGHSDEALVQQAVGDLIELEVVQEEKAAALERMLALLRLDVAGRAGADNTALRRAVLSQLEEDSLALPCRSQAQCIAATGRVVEVLTGMAAALEEQADRWQGKELPRIQAQAHRLWQQGRSLGERQDWKVRLVESQERLVRFALDLFKTHIQGNTSRVRVQRASGVLEVAFCDVLEFEQRLCIATLPQQPAKVAPAPKHTTSRPAAAPNKQQQQQQGDAAHENRGALGAGVETDSLGGRQSGGMGSSGGVRRSDSLTEPPSSSLTTTSSATESGAESDLGSHRPPSGGQPSGAAHAAEAEGKIIVAEGGTTQQAERDEVMPEAKLMPDGGGTVGGQREGEESSAEESGEDDFVDAHEELPSASQAPRTASRAPRVWNIPGLVPGQTKVIWAPGMASPGTAGVVEGEGKQQPVEQTEPLVQQQQQQQKLVGQQLQECEQAAQRGIEGVDAMEVDPAPTAAVAVPGPRAGAASNLGSGSGTSQARLASAAIACDVAACAHVQGVGEALQVAAGGSKAPSTAMPADMQGEPSSDAAKPASEASRGHEGRDGSHAGALGKQQPPLQQHEEEEANGVELEALEPQSEFNIELSAASQPPPFDPAEAEAQEAQSALRDTRQQPEQREQQEQAGPGASTDVAGAGAGGDSLMQDAASPAGSDEAGMNAGLLGGLAAGSAVEVCSTAGGVPCWAHGFLVRRIGPTTSTALVEVLGDQGQVCTHTTALEQLRIPRTLPLPTGPARQHSSPHLRAAELRVGRLYELDVLQLGKEMVEGQQEATAHPQRRWARYVPAIVVAKGRPHKESRFSDMYEDDEWELGGIARLVHLFSQEAAEEQEAGGGSGIMPGSTSGPIKLWLLQLGSTGVTEVVYTEGQLGAHPLVRECEAWNSTSGGWGEAFSLRRQHDETMLKLVERREGGAPESEKLAAEEAAQQEYLRWRDLRIPSKEYLALRLRATGKRSELLQTLAWTALQRLSKQLERAQDRSQVTGRQEAPQAKQAVLRVLRRHFMRGYLARNPCCDFSRLMSGPLEMGQPAEESKEDEAPNQPFIWTAPKEGRARARSSKAIRAAPLRRLVKQADSRKREREAAQSADIREMLERLAERERKRQRTSAVKSPVAIVPRDMSEEGSKPLWEGEEAGRKGMVLIPGRMAQALKAHQWEGVRWVWDSLVMDFAEDADLAGGCILAHHMGLGKSLQTIAFLHCFHALHPGSRSLVIVPKIVKMNWKQEFEKWLPMPLASQEEGYPGLTMRRVYLYDGYASSVHKWHKASHGTLIMTHEEFRMALGRKRKLPAKAGVGAEDPGGAGRPSSGAGEAAGKSISATAAATPVDSTQQPAGAALAAEQPGMRGESGGGPGTQQLTTAEMLAEGPAVVVIDEAHVIKNPKSKLRQALGRVKTKRRLALTGYPLQNNLREMHAMVSWCNEEVLGDAKTFEEQFVVPIIEGQLPWATRHAVRKMCKKLSVLHDLTDKIVHRKGEELLRCDLPPKQEHIIKLHLSPVQDAVYQAYLEGVEASGKKLFRDRERLNELCDRPSSFKVWLQLLCATPAVAPAAGEDAEAAAPALAAAAAQVTGPAGGEAGQAAGDASQQQLRLASQEQELNEVVEKEAQEDAAANDEAAATKEALKAALPAELARKLLDIIEAAEARGEDFGTQGTSKMWALRQLVQYCLDHGEQLIVVAERLLTLDAVEVMLAELGRQRGQPVAWCKLTGQSTAKERQSMVKQLSRKGKLQVFIMSKAGSHGINLVSCRRIAVLDEPWNPVFNAQAIARIFRYGQSQPTFVYRLCYNGSMQYNIYLRNINKAALFRRVVDKQAVKYTKNKIEEDQLSVYSFKVDSLDEQEMAALRANPALDPALAALLAADTPEAGGPHIAVVEDHDKNLADDPSQRLTAEEKKEAVAQFVLEQTSQQRAGAGGTVTQSQSKRLSKIYGDLDLEAAMQAQQAAELAQGLEGQDGAHNQTRLLAAASNAAAASADAAAAAMATVRHFRGGGGGVVDAAVGGWVAGAAAGAPAGVRYLAGGAAALAGRVVQAALHSSIQQQQQQQRSVHQHKAAQEQQEQPANARRPGIAGGMNVQVYNFLKHHSVPMQTHMAHGGTFESYTAGLVAGTGCGTEGILWQRSAQETGLAAEAVQKLLRDYWQSFQKAGSGQQAQQGQPTQPAPQQGPQQAQQAPSVILQQREEHRVAGAPQPLAPPALPPTAGLQPSGSGGGPLSFLRTDPRFGVMRIVAQRDPGALQPMLAHLLQTNPVQHTLVYQYQKEFLAYINEPIPAVELARYTQHLSQQQQQQQVAVAQQLAHQQMGMALQHAQQHQRHVQQRTAMGQQRAQQAQPISQPQQRGVEGGTVQAPAAAAVAHPAAPQQQQQQQAPLVASTMQAAAGVVVGPSQPPGGGRNHATASGQADKWATFNRDYGRNLDLVQSRLKQWEEVINNMKATGKQPSNAMLQQHLQMQAYAAHLLEENDGQSREKLRDNKALRLQPWDQQQQQPAHEQLAQPQPGRAGPGGVAGGHRIMGTGMQQQQQQPPGPQHLLQPQQHLAGAGGAEAGGQQPELLRTKQQQQQQQRAGSEQLSHGQRVVAAEAHLQLPSVLGVMGSVQPNLLPAAPHRQEPAQQMPKAEPREGTPRTNGALDSATVPTGSAKRQRLDSQPQEVLPEQEAEDGQQRGLGGGMPKPTASRFGQLAGSQGSGRNNKELLPHLKQKLRAARGHARAGSAAADSASLRSSQQQPAQQAQGSSGSGDASAGSSFQPPALVGPQQAPAPSQGGDPAGAALPAPQRLSNAVAAAATCQAGAGRLNAGPRPSLGVETVAGARAGGSAGGDADVIDLTQD